MAVDWGFAGLIGGVGFGAVFVLLVVLGVVIWLVGVIVNKIGTGKSETSDKRRGD